MTRPLPTDTSATTDSPVDDLPILYQDDDFVAVAKPAGMFIHRTVKDRRERQVVMQTVRNQLRRPVFVVHRLDRPASGIVLLALSSQAAAAASELFRERQITKSYRVLVRGHSPASGFIDRPLRKPDAQDSEPRPASTSFETDAWYNVPMCSDRFPTTFCSLVTVTPQTGRFHQIRRHLNGIHCPVIADTSHGDSRQNVFFRTEFGVERLMLHATSLSFELPLTGAPVAIHCPLPNDFAGVIKRLAPYQCDRTPG